MKYIHYINRSPLLFKGFPDCRCLSLILHARCAGMIQSNADLRDPGRDLEDHFMAVLPIPHFRKGRYSGVDIRAMIFLEHEDDLTISPELAYSSIPLSMT